jgi:hypothetical protein
MRETEIFEIEAGGRKYECSRTISGKNDLIQEVAVAGVGSKKDSATYGPKGHPYSSMLTTARLIAHEIVREVEARARRE